MRELARFRAELGAGHFGVDADGAGEGLDEADRVRKRRQMVVVVGLDRGEVAQRHARVARDVDQVEAARSPGGGKDRADRPRRTVLSRCRFGIHGGPSVRTRANSRGRAAKSMRCTLA